MNVTHETQWSPSIAELSHGLEHDEFAVYYQPIVDLQSGQMVGAEALIRWQHPERGLLSSGSFIEQAEAAGFGLPLAEWVQRTACRQVQAWSMAALDLPIVSMNLSPAQARPECLGSHLRSLLDETGIDPHQLAIEIHELFLPEPENFHLLLAELASVGIPLWIDDFGTGPSAVPYLAHFPFSVLKIDKAFVWTMIDDPRWAKIVTGLIGFAHHLGLRVIAEGVRSAEELEFLCKYGCDMVQGGYFSLPVPVDELTALLQSGGHMSPKTGYVD